jgi:hypothetical protein
MKIIVQRRKFIMSINIGFIGIDKYDLVLYLSRILAKCNKKVLIIDNSESLALSYCISVPSSLNPKCNIISCKEMDYIQDGDLANYENDYDYILIDYGFRNNHRDIKYCQKLFLVTDTQQHNIDKLNYLKMCPEEIYIIVKNMMGRLKKENIIVSLGFSVKESFSLEFDEFDYRKMINMQYEGNVWLKKLSASYLFLLERIIVDILKEDSKLFVQAYKNLKRGA